jgi:O-methyltransferase/aklanonic acid methyltransferase
MDGTAPAPSDPNEVSALYDRVAPHYGLVGPDVFGRLGRRLVEAAGVGEGDRVLDVGTGRGACLIPSAEAIGERGRVVGVDLSAAMVRETVARVSRYGLRNAEVLRMDAGRLAFADSAFDRVLCAFAIFLFSSPEAALAEWRRVLRPGGRIGVSIAGRGDERWRWYEERLLALHEAHGLPLSPTSGGLRQPDEIKTALAEAGFTDVQAISEEHEFRYADGREWWAAKWTHGARYPLERMPPQVMEEFRAEVLERIDRMDWTRGPRERWRLVCIVASKPDAG